MYSIFTFDSYAKFMYKCHELYKYGYVHYTLFVILTHDLLKMRDILGRCRSCAMLLLQVIACYDK